MRCSSAEEFAVDVLSSVRCEFVFLHILVGSLLNELTKFPESGFAAPAVPPALLDSQSAGV